MFFDVGTVTFTFANKGGRVTCGAISEQLDIEHIQAINQIG